MNEQLLAMDSETDMNTLTAGETWIIFTSVLNDQMKRCMWKSDPKVKTKNLDDQEKQKKEAANTWKLSAHREAFGLHPCNYRENQEI